MPHMNILLDGDGCWPDLKERPEGQVLDLPIAAVAFLPGGMSSGKPSICFRFELPDGRTVLAQTSNELLQAAARAFKGRLEYLEEQAASSKGDA